MKLLRVFDQFGFGSIGLSEADFLEENFVIEIGREPRKIQVLTGIDGVSFADCCEHRLEMESDGVMMKFIGKDDLLINKASSARPKDLIDLEVLRKL